jgi:uncharacterized protein (DUF2267 family)
MTRDDFIDLVSRRLGSDRARADAIVQAVMATVRDGLDDDEARQVAAYLPAAISGLLPERTGARPEVPEIGGRGFLAIVRARAGLESDHAAGRAIRTVFGAMMESSGVVGRRGAWDGLSHLPPELKSIWMRIFRSASFSVERLIHRP